jgi:hypothetical protein
MCMCGRRGIESFDSFTFASPILATIKQLGTYSPARLRGEAMHFTENLSVPRRPLSRWTSHWMIWPRHRRGGQSTYYYSVRRVHCPAQPGETCWTLAATELFGPEIHGRFAQETTDQSLGQRWRGQYVLLWDTNSANTAGGKKALVPGPARPYARMRK